MRRVVPDLCHCGLANLEDVAAILPELGTNLMAFTQIMLPDGQRKEINFHNEARRAAYCVSPRRDGVASRDPFA